MTLPDPHPASPWNARFTEAAARVRAQAAPKAPRNRRWFSTGRVFVPLALAGLAGLGVFRWMPSSYRVSGRFDLISDELGPAATDSFRALLVEQTWQTLQQGAAADSPPVGWGVEAAAEPAALTVWFTGPDAPALRAQVEATARGFLAELQRRAERALSNPTPQEQWLGAELVKQRQTLDRLRSEVRQAEANIPAEDPRGEYGERLAELRDKRAALLEAQAQFEASSAQLVSLTGAEPDLSARLAIDPEARRLAEAQDTKLVQDQRELEIRYGEIRGLLQELWNATAGPLGELLTDTGALRAAAGPDPDRRLDETFAADLERLGLLTEELEAQVSNFAQNWAALLGDIGNLQENGPDLIELRVQLETALDGLRFGARKKLDEMDDQLRVVSHSGPRRAKHHTLLEGLLGQYATVERKLQDLLGAGSRVYLTKDFRLDAAVRAARGFRRRIAERKNDIDACLKERALREAKASLTADVAATRELMAQWEDRRKSLTQAVLAVQERVNDFTPRVIRYHQALQDWDAQRTMEARQEREVADLEGRCEDARRARRVELPPEAVHFAGPVGDDEPANGRRKVLLALSSGAAIALAMIAAFAMSATSMHAAPKRGETHA